MVGFGKKALHLQLQLPKLRSHFLGRFEGNWAWEVRGSWAYKWCRNLQFWWQRGKAFVFGQDDYIKMNFMVNFWSHLKWCFQKFDKEFHSYTAVKRLPFNSPKLRVLTPLECSLNVINCQKWGKTPYESISFWWLWISANIGEAILS